MNVFPQKNNHGFNLIELLIVIAIISVLASIVLVNLSGARLSARDAQRISDIRQIRIALELYRGANGNYPPVAGFVQSNNSNWSDLQNQITPYMSKLPVDPINNDTGGVGPWAAGKYNYAYYSDGSTSPYDLVAQLENTESPLRCAVKSWIFYNSGVSWCGPYSPYIYTGDY